MALQKVVIIFLIIFLAQMPGVTRSQNRSLGELLNVFKEDPF